MKRARTRTRQEEETASSPVPAVVRRSSRIASVSAEALDLSQSLKRKRSISEKPQRSTKKTRSSEAEASSSDEDSEENIEVKEEAKPAPKHFPIPSFRTSMSDHENALHELLSRLGGGGYRGGGRMSGHLGALLEGLRDEGDETRQLIALTELNEYLVMANEETMSGFSLEMFLPVLLRLLEMEHNPDIMLLAMRCLSHTMEALPPSATIISQIGAVPVFVAKLMDLSYIDLAECALQALEKMSYDQPGVILKSGGLTAVLAHLDFFSIALQRVALSLAANLCRQVEPGTFDMVADSFPTLANLLNYTDQRVLESACLCFARLAENLFDSEKCLRSFAEAGVLTSMLRLLDPLLRKNVSPAIHGLILRTLCAVARASPSLSFHLLENGVVSVLQGMLVGSGDQNTSATSADLNISGLSPGMPVSPAAAAVSQFADQTHLVLRLANDLLPEVSFGFPQGPKDAETPAASQPAFGRSRMFGRDNRRNYENHHPLKPQVGQDERRALLMSQGDLLRTFGSSVFEPLVATCSATVSPTVRQLCMTVIVKVLTFADVDTMTLLLKDMPFSSFLASQLGSRDAVMAAMAVHAAKLLMDKMPDVFSLYFGREGVFHEINVLATPTGALDASSAPRRAAARRSTRRLSEGLAIDTSMDDDEDRAAESRPKASPSMLSQSASARAAELRAWTAGEARTFLEQYGAEDAKEDNAAVSPMTAQLRDLCGELAALTGTPGADDVSVLRRLSDALSQRAAGAGAVSTFEFMSANVAPGVLHYLTELVGTDVTLSEAAMLRLKAFAHVFLRLPDLADRDAPPSTSPVVPLSLLVRQLQDALAKVERFPVLLHSPPGTAGDMRVFGQPFKLRIERDPDEEVLEEYATNTVLIEPLAMMPAVEEFVLAKLPPTNIAAAHMLVVGATATGRVGGGGGGGGGGGRFGLFGDEEENEDAEEDVRGTAETVQDVLLRSTVASAVASAVPSEDGDGDERSDGKPADDATADSVGDGDGDVVDMDSTPLATPTAAGGSGPGAATTAPVAVPHQSRNRRQRKRDMRKSRARAASAAAATPGGAAGGPAGGGAGAGSPGKGDTAKGSPGKGETAKGSPGKSDTAKERAAREKVAHVEAARMAKEAAREAARLARAAKDAAKEAAKQERELARVRREREEQKNRDSARRFVEALAEGREGGPVARLARNERPHIIGLTLDGELLPYHLSIFQAIVQLQKARGAIADGYDEGGAASSAAMWQEIYTIRYRCLTPAEFVALNAPRDGTRRDLTTGNDDDAVVEIGIDTTTTMSTATSEHFDAPATAQPSVLAAAVSFELPAEVPRDEPVYEILRLLRLLSVVNQHHHTLYPNAAGVNADPVVPASDFVSTVITAKLMRQLQDPLTICAECLPDWCGSLTMTCPFVFPFEARRLYFDTTTFGVGRALIRFHNAVKTAMGANAARVGRIARQKVRIQRERMLESAMKVMESYAKSRAMLEVEYFNEVGTGLGPTLEFYSCVSRELQRSKYGLWRSDDATPNLKVRSPMKKAARTDAEGSPFVYAPNGLFPVPLPTGTAKRREAASKVLSLFRFLGRFVAKAMLDSRLIDLPLSEAFFKRMLGQTLTVRDLANVDPVMAKSIDSLDGVLRQRRAIEASTALAAKDRAAEIAALTLDGVRIEDLCLSFTLPGQAGVELCPDGANVPVTIDNLDKYIQAVVAHTLGTGVDAQFNAFQRGFIEVFPITRLRLFSPAELEVEITGIDAPWEVEDMREHIKTDHGYEATSPIVADLLAVMHEFDHGQRRAFLRFMTGCPRLPCGGWSALRPPFTVVRTTLAATQHPDDYMPSVMTCQNFLKLPQYTSRVVLKMKLLQAMFEGQEGFLMS